MDSLVREGSLRIDRHAAASILGAPVQIILSEASAGLLSPDAAVRVTLFDEDGCLYDPRLSRRGQAALVPAGPHGVLLIACLAEQIATAERIRACLAFYDAKPLPGLLVLPPGDDLERRLALGDAIARALGLHVMSQHVALAQRDEEVATLRQANEWQSLSLRLGREMVEAVGYAARVLAYETPRGMRTIGRGGTIPTDVVIQRLPVDLAGLTGLSVHVAAAARSEGHLIVTLGRNLGRPAARAEIAFTDLVEGWNDIILPEAAGPNHGDAMLTLAFMAGAGKATPTLSLSDEEVDRFGVISPPLPATLSLKVWRGLSGQAFSDAQPISNRRHRIAVDALQHKPRFVFGAAEEAVLVQRYGLPRFAEVKGGGLFLRPLASQATGALLKQALPEGTVSARVTFAPEHGVRTPEQEEEVLTPLLVNVAALRPEWLDLDALRSPPAASADASDRSMDLIAASAAGRFALSRDLVLQITFDEPLQTACDLAIVLRPEGEVSGLLPTCRLQSITIDQEEPREHLGPATTRRVPFPELKTRVAYVSGSAEAVRLSSSLGFSVLDISDTQNFMQIHPMLDRITGARGVGLLPSGVRRIAAEVMTAHPQGPITEYGLLVVRRGFGSEAPLAFEEMLASVLDGGEQPASVLGLTRVEAHPGRSERLILDFDEPLSEPADLICTVRTLSAHINYAWCRWYSIETTIALGAAARHHFTAPPQ
ncbi:MAG TPA: DUF6212 domain-containing protein [Microvirga sp.]|nr:DUF6212 domain-containing protein [Microvirga sp.]